MKRKSEPKLWIANFEAYDTKKKEWSSGVVVSMHAHITRSAGLRDVEEGMYSICPPKTFSKYKIITCHGIPWKQIENAFSDFIWEDDDDDSGGNDDTPEIEPSPEDNGVEMPELFSNLINGLDLQ